MMSGGLRARSASQGKKQATTPTTTSPTPTPTPTDAEAWHDAAAEAATPAWYQSGGFLDQLDRRISLPLLACPSLGPLEYVLMIPGSIFGVPIYGLFFATFVVAMLWDCTFSPEAHALDASITSPSLVTLAGMLAATVGLAFYSSCIYESTQPNIDLENQGINRLFQPLGRKVATFVNIFSPNVAIGVIGFLCSLAATEDPTDSNGSVSEEDLAKSYGPVAVGSFYVTTYLVCNLFIEFVKTVSRRLRPVVSMEAELRHVKRELPQNQWIFKQGHAKGSSFPSSDVAGATLFATLLQYLVQFDEQAQSTLAAGCVLVAISMFMRGYFQAHHIGDIIAGAIIGASSVMLMAYYAGPIEQFTYMDCLKAQGIVYPLWSSVQKLKPKSAQSILNAGNLFEGKSD